MIRPHTNASGLVFQVYGKQRIDGQWQKTYVGTYGTEREAKLADQDFKARQRLIADGELPAAIDPRRTLGQSLDAWIAHLKTLPVEEFRSLVQYESRIRNHIPDELRALALTKIDKRRLLALQTQLKASKVRRRATKDAPATASLAPANVNNIFVALSSAFTWFREQGWITENHVRDVRPLKVRKRNDAGNGGGYRWFRDLADVTKVISMITSETTRTVIAVLVGTGLRAEECLHLRASDIDLKTRLIHVRRGTHDMTKSGKDRHVPIGDSVLPILRQRVVAAGKDGLLWPGSSENRKHKGKPAARMSVYLGFKRALKRLGLDERLRLHDLRHTYASHFVMAGGNIFELSRILGHHSVTVTERTYAHLAPDAYEKNRNLVAFSMPAPKAGKVIAMKVHAIQPAVTSRTR